jgi:hypothetical protein
MLMIAPLSDLVVHSRGYSEYQSSYLKDFFLDLCLHNYNLLMVEIK